MSLSLSPQVRLVALLTLLAGTVALAGMFFLLRGTLLPQEAEPAPIVHRPKPAPQTTPSTIGAEAQRQIAATPAKPVTEPEPAKPVSKPKPVQPVAANGLPVQVATALRERRVVVVALVVPGARLDELAVAEARAGAMNAGAGFVSLDVLRNAVGRPIAEKHGVVETPALLVYRRPATVAYRIDGFADRDTVAQAATSARTGR